MVKTQTSVQEQKQKFGHSTKAVETRSYSKSYSTWFRWLMSHILWKIVSSFLPSTAEFLDFTVSLSTLLALNNYLKVYAFAMIIKGDFNTTKKFPWNYLTNRRAFINVITIFFLKKIDEKIITIIASFPPLCNPV